MLKNISITMAVAVFAIGVFGCAQFNMAETDTPLDKNWGRSYESARYNQILNPEADENLEPVEGIPGPAAEKIVAGAMASGCDSKSKQ